MDENNNRKGHSYTSKGPRGKRDFSKRGHGKPGFSGGRGAGHGKDFKDGKREFRRKLEPGVEFIDRKLGVGIVRKVSEDGITVVFGDLEKVIPRRKPEDRKPGGRFADKDRRGGRFEKSGRPPLKRTNAKGEPIEKKIFSFDPSEMKPAPVKKEEKDQQLLGLVVIDDVLGKGTASRITERGTYVTYEATGEHVMYPTGLPQKLLHSASPATKKAKKDALPKGKGRTYTVPEGETRKEKAAPSTGSPKETRHGNTVYFELGIGTLVHSPLYGNGKISEIGSGRLTVAFDSGDQEFRYPQAFADGEIAVITED